jgi:hypothetical protein
VGLEDRNRSREELVKVYTDKKVRFSTQRTMGKAEQLRENKDNVRAPNATQRAHRVDITPRMQYKLNVKNIRAKSKEEREAFFREIQLVYAAMDPPKTFPGECTVGSKFVELKQLMKAGLGEEAKGNYPKTNYMIQKFEFISNSRGCKQAKHLPLPSDRELSITYIG